MSRADADALAREMARQLVAEAYVKLRQPVPDEAWLGGWVGKAWAALEQLGQEPEPDDDPPDYDHAAADRAEEHAAAQAELAAIEAEEAHDAAGEAWYEATYGQGGTS